MQGIQNILDCFRDIYNKYIKTFVLFELGQFVYRLFQALIQTNTKAKRQKSSWN